MIACRSHILGCFAVLSACSPPLSASPPSGTGTTPSNHLERSAGGMERDSDAAPPGWFRAGSPGSPYEIGVDSSVARNGSLSGTLKSKPDRDAHEGEYIAYLQSISAKSFAARWVELSAFVRTEGKSPLAALWMRVDNQDGSWILDNMHDRLVSGPHDWTHCTVRLPIAEADVRILFGATFSGEGQMWFDDVTIRQIDPPSDAGRHFLKGCCNRKASEGLRDEPVNLDFEAVMPANR
jgi:hypothetical protein